MTRIPGLVLTDHTFTVPLDHASPSGESISVFAREVVAPGAAERDSIEKGRVDWKTIHQGHGIGLLRMALPKEIGGLGLGQLALALVLEELADADGPVVAMAFGPGLTLYAALLVPA